MCIIHTDVAEAIIRVAENGGDAEGAGVFDGCDVIAMATHELGGLDSSAIGSMTERVLRDKTSHVDYSTDNLDEEHPFD